MAWRARWHMAAARRTMKLNDDEAREQGPQPYVDFMIWLGMFVVPLALLGTSWRITIAAGLPLAAFMTLAASSQMHDLRVSWRKLTRPQRLHTLSIGGAIVLGLWAYMSSVTSAHQRLLAEQLHLPAGATFAEFRSQRSNSTKPRRERIEAIVRFSPSQFDTYVASLTDARIWRPVPFTYDGVPVTGPYSSDALRWTDAERPSFAGNRRVQWGFISRQMEPSDSGTQHLCFAAQHVSPRTDTPAGQAAFEIRACSEVPRTASTFVYLLAAIDVDTRSLHVIVN